jgi:hypothetical protein
MLSPEQEERAVQAAREIEWHRTQVKRWELLYQGAVQVGDLEEARGIAGMIDWHNQAIEAAQRILGTLGF